MSELVVPILAEVAKPMVEVLVRRISQEIHLFWEFEKELKKLEHKITVVGTVLGSTDGNMVSGEAPKVWLRNLIHIIYKAEDMFDVLAYEKHRGVVMKRRSKKAFKGKVRLIFAPLERVIFRCKIGRHIRSITDDFKDALKEANEIVQLKNAVRSSTSASTSTHPTDTKMNNDKLLHHVRQYVDMSVFIGRESDVRSVVDKLCNPSHWDSQSISSNHRIHVVAIVGIGGLGKTSLARKVYEDEQVISYFSERIWIPDLKEFDINKTLNKMVEFVGKATHHESHSTETAIRKLGECLGGKRYLLVLDDVWDTNQHCWDSLRYQLERIGGSMESMVLTTTRDDDVANAMNASAVHPLCGLSDHDSWSLFHKIALENRSVGDASALEAPGREIVKKCKGIPLAIKSIAGLLRKKRNPDEWNIIQESELWDIPQQETGILPSLKLSYDHLSSPLLKKCFALCAILPNGFWFDKYDFIHRWIALGLIQNSNNKNLTLEDIGEEYLNELLSISFLFVKTRNEIGEAFQYTIHDLVYNLARSVAMHDRLYLEAGKEVSNVFDIQMIQHLSVFGHAEMTLGFPDNSVLENIRSLDTVWKLPRGLLRHMKYLRVLSLYQSNVEELPETISKLKCLKFLDLTDNPIKVFPECILELYNLQSLILYRCKQLVKIPGDRFDNLMNLRHLGSSVVFCPAKGILTQLLHLQTLPPLQLSQGEFQITELGSLHHIRGNLEIKGLQLVKNKSDAENVNLSKKARVDQLRLSWDNDDKNCLNSEEVLDGLCPHPNLKLLSINGYGGDKFPSWVMKMNVCGEHNGNGYAGSLCNLIKFELINCGRCQQLPTLGHLSSLKKIVIRNMGNVEHIGPEFYHCGADPMSGNENQPSSSSSSCMMKSFAGLKQLELCHLGNLVEWCEPGAWCGFPSLEELVIEGCLKLERMPNDFPSLRELSVIGMISSVSLLSIMSNKTSVRCLKKLHIENVKEVTYIPEELVQCTSLQTLSIQSCINLRSLPKRLSKLVSLVVLIIKWCPNLVTLPILSGLVSLREFVMSKNDGLKLFGCPSMVSLLNYFNGLQDCKSLDFEMFINEWLRDVPMGLQTCKSLEKLWINCCAKVETLPDLGGLSRLSDLSILGMTKMIRQPPDWLLYSLTCLRVLNIGYYTELNEFPDLRPLLNITSLQQLNVYGWEKLESIPQQLQLFTNLKFLSIVDFENIEYLPDCLGNLSSLQELVPIMCQNLKKIPSEDAMKRLTNLRYLVIRDCPLLEEATNINGPEYHKITAAGIQVLIENTTNN